MIRSILEGNREAYAELIQAYQAKVLRLCSALLRDPTLAQDAAQDIFLKTYQALGSFRGGAAFSTWLYRIAANHCKDLLRQRTRQRIESWEALIEEQGEMLQVLLTHPGDPRAAVVSADLIERVLSQLAPEERLILTLREMEGLSYQELAEALACSIDAVKARLRRARQTLHEKLRHISRPTSV